ncbi:hypothetical protein KJE20_14398, partial [Pyrenophora tritici-repentis]
MSPYPEVRKNQAHTYDGMNHMLNLVHFEDKDEWFVVDVGMGAMGPNMPYPLRDNFEVTSIAPRKIRLQKRAIGESYGGANAPKLWCYDVCYDPSHGADNKWIPTYCFTENEFLPQDYEVMSWFTSTHSRSFFTRYVTATKMIMVKSVPTGSAEFEELRWAKLNKLDAKVPKDLYLPSTLIENPPLDVTQIPRTCGILTPEEIEITESYDAVGLAAAIAERRYTAVAVAKAFSRRAIICHQITCCLTQWFPEDAIKQAQALDDHLALTGKVVVPYTVFPSRRCRLGGFVRAAGAVFYVKTMQPQGLLHLESDSPLGRVLNPYNINLSAGGSSGGEAALLALRGSVLGVGTDIGGSVRGPAAFCGIYGFKPTAYTLPISGLSPGAFPPALNIMPSVGPMCRSLRDCDLFMRSVLEQWPYLVDPLLIPLPWTGLKTPTSARKLKIGIMVTDGMITPMPPITRALAWAESRLQSFAGVEVKSFRPYQAKEGLTLVRRLFLPDGGVGFRALLAAIGEPEHHLSTAVLSTATDASSLGAVAQLRVDRDDYRRHMAAHWNAEDVDVVLMPAFVGPASAHDT